MKPSDVLDYWFADSVNDADAAAQRMGFWFEGSDATDADIRQRFSGLIEPAAAGDYSEWGGNPRDCLALILILDQFPRNLYRGTGAAFKHDALAFGLTVVGQRLAYLESLTPIEQVFFLMPYQHIEDVERQREGVMLYQELADSVGADWRSLVSGCRDFAQMHLDIVEQFGRFPHRNAALGRESTAAELAYLADGESFGQG